MSVTIVDIARYAGVSKSTVSRILNHRRGVSPAARKRVLSAVDALSYKPSAAARSLVLKRTNSISLIVQDIRNPYFASAAWYAERIFRRHGYDLVIHNGDNDRDLEKEILEAIKYRTVDGVLSIGGNRNVTAIIDFFAQDRLPLVLVDREIHGYDIPTINLNNRLGGFLATDFLLAHGHRSIVFATSDFTVAETRRGEGYLDAYRARGLEPPPDAFISAPEELWGEGRCPAFERLIGRGPLPTAVFASNDLKAVQIMRILRSHDLRVPEDLSVVGYDDVYPAGSVFPALTTVHQPLEHMVEAGALLLLEMADGRRVEPNQQPFEPWLIERESAAWLRRGEDGEKDAAVIGSFTQGAK